MDGARPLGMAGNGPQHVPAHGAGAMPVARQTRDFLDQIQDGCWPDIHLAHETRHATMMSWACTFFDDHVP